MAIATIHQGIEYRSRLEARWAALFDCIGWQHTYEPFDGDGYIPDFLIHGALPLLVEVKPAVSTGDFEAAAVKTTAGLRNHWTRDILIVGADPLPDAFDKVWANDMPVAGMLLEGDHHGWGGGRAGCWMTCGHCGQIGVFSDIGFYGGRPCGHADGDHYLRSIAESSISSAWADATNAVKWRGKAV